MTHWCPFISFRATRSIRAYVKDKDSTLSVFDQREYQVPFGPWIPTTPLNINADLWSRQIMSV